MMTQTQIPGVDERQATRWPALLLLPVLAVALRVFSFLPAVMDHDESTYILIGRGMLEGQTYLTDLIDTKPVGIFLIYAGMLAVWPSIFGLRLMTAIVVGLTAFFLYLLGRRATGSKRVGWAAGIMYTICTSIWTHYGVSPNTELFFNAFTAAAMAVAWSSGTSVWRYALAGLLLGTGFIIKYVTAADAFALGLFLLVSGFRERAYLAAILRVCLPLTVAFFIPIALVYGYYASQGLAETFRFYTFAVTSRYPVEAPLWRRMLFTLDFLGRFAPLTLLAVGAWLERRPTDRSLQQFALLWFSCAMVMTLLPGKIFGHYQIQLLPPLCVLAATFFHPERRRFSFTRRLPLRYGLALLAFVAVLITTLHGLKYLREPDEARIAADYLRARLGAGEVFYPGDYHHILYFLLDQRPLTPYIHRSLLYTDSHIDALQVDIGTEARRILSQAPDFILLQEDEPGTALRDSIFAHYAVTDSVPAGEEMLLVLEPRRSEE